MTFTLVSEPVVVAGTATVAVHLWHVIQKEGLMRQFKMCHLSTENVQKVSEFNASRKFLHGGLLLFLFTL